MRESSSFHCVTVADQVVLDVVSLQRLSQSRIWVRGVVTQKEVCASDPFFSSQRPPPSYDVFHVKFKLQIDGNCDFRLSCAETGPKHSR